MGGYQPGMVLLIAGLAINVVAVALDDGVAQVVLFAVGISALLASVFFLVGSRRR